MWSCTVEFLAGKRATVQVSPNTPLIKVLEQACKKFTFNPEEYVLKHGRAVLDLTVPVFYANLPNRAKLEAVKGVGVGSTRAPPTTDVLIAIQLPSGERLQERCSATTTLWDVVMKAAPNLLDPAVVYMRQHISGSNNLKNTTLQELGLSKGKAIIRLLSQESHVSAPIEKEGKPVSEETSADIIVPHSPNGQSEVVMMEANSDSSLKPAEHQMDQSNFSSDSLVDVRLFPKSSPSVGQSDVPKNSPSVGQSDVPKSSPSVGQSDVPKNSPSVGQSDVPKSSPSVGQSDVPKNSPSVGQSDVPKSSPSVGQSDVPKSSPSVGQSDVPKSSPSVGQSDVPKNSPSVGQSDVPKSSPSVGQSDVPKNSPSVGQSDVPKSSPSVGQSDVPKNSPSVDQSDVPKNSPSVGQSESLLTTITAGEAMDTSQHQSMGSDSVHIGVADVGVSDTAIPTVPDKSENITLNKSADTDLTQIIKEADKLDSPVTLATASRKEEVHNESQAEHARHFIVYHKSCLPDGPVEDMPESFYNVTAEDIHIVRRDLFTQIASSEEKPLMTKIMRQIERFVQFDKYKKAVIKIQFPDGWILQGLFEATETLRSIVLFIRQHLSKRDLKFHLYTSPPKSILRGARNTLIEAGLTPAAVVYFGPENPTFTGPFLSETCLSTVPKEVTDQLVHMRDIASKSVKKYKKEATTAVPSVKPTPAAEGTSSQDTKPSVNSSSKTSKAPLWLKMGLK